MNKHHCVENEEAAARPEKSLGEEVYDKAMHIDVRLSGVLGRLDSLCAHIVGVEPDELSEPPEAVPRVVGFLPRLMAALDSADSALLLIDDRLDVLETAFDPPVVEFGVDPSDPFQSP